MRARVVAATLAGVVGWAGGASAYSALDVTGIAAGATVATGGDFASLMKMSYKGVQRWAPVTLSASRWVPWASRVLWWGGAAALAYTLYKDFWLTKEVWTAGAGYIVEDPVTGGIRVQGVLYPPVPTSYSGYGNYGSPGLQYVSFKVGEEGKAEAMANRAQWLQDALPDQGPRITDGSCGTAGCTSSQPPEASGKWRAVFAFQCMRPPYSTVCVDGYSFPWLAAAPTGVSYRPVAQSDLADALEGEAAAAGAGQMDPAAQTIGESTLDELGRAVTGQPGSFAQSADWPATHGELDAAAQGSAAGTQLEADVDAMPETERATTVGSQQPGAVAITDFQGAAVEQMAQAHKEAALDPQVLTGQQNATHDATVQALEETVPGALAADRALQEAAGQSAGLPNPPTVDGEIEQPEKPETLKQVLTWARGQLSTLPWVSYVSGMTLTCSGSPIVTGTVRGNTVTMDFSTYESTFDLCGNILLTFTWFLWGRRVLGAS